MSKAKGEVGFDADGGRFTLVFSIDALCNLEEAAGCSIAKIGKIWADPDQPQLHTVKAAFWAALTDHHPNITKQEAGRLMNSLGFVKAGELVLEAFSGVPGCRKGEVSRPFGDQAAAQQQARTDWAPAHREWVALGLDPMLFWHVTPKVAQAIVDGRNERTRRDHNNRAWLAWHIAVLPHQRRVPALKSLMIPARRSKPQTWQEQMHVARMIAVAYGGNVN